MECRDIGAYGGYFYYIINRYNNKENETVCSFCRTKISGAAEKPAAAQVPSPIPVPASPAIPSAPTLTPPAAARMIEKHVCSGCKKEYHDGTKFCPECGGKIELVQVSVPAPAPPLPLPR